MNIHNMYYFIIILLFNNIFIIIFFVIENRIKRIKNEKNRSKHVLNEH